MTRDFMERLLMVRVSCSDAHYAGSLVDGAFIMRLFGDALTFLACRDDGDEGLLASYETVEFKDPIHPGDFIAVSCRETARSRLSRTIELLATRQGRSTPMSERVSAAEAWDEADQIVATARARIVIPMASIRRSGAGR